VKRMPTLCITRKIEGGVEVVDEATGADTLSVIHVVWSGKHRPEEKKNVIIPYDRERFVTGSSLTPKGNLGE
jgi:hypothetical protein